MPRQNDYPRWRYLTMQASMWVILLGTIGIAALTSHYKRGSLVVTLGEPRPIESISVRLPSDWEIEREGNDAITATDGGTRVIYVQEREVTWMDRLADATAFNSSKKQTVQIIIGPTTGLLSVTRTRSLESRRSDPNQYLLELKTSGKLRNGSVLSITLACLERDQRNESDAVELLKQIAASVQYLDQ